jgi:tRNA 2-thiouridine synthesizing protein E
MGSVEVNGKTVEIDGEGYVQNFKEWERDVAVWLAKEDNLVLTDDHLVVAKLLREFYASHESIPTAKELAKLMGNALGDEKGNSKYLAELFPNDPIKLSGKISGLPRMPGCT